MNLIGMPTSVKERDFWANVQPLAHGHVQVWCRTEAGVVASLRAHGVDENALLTPGDLLSLQRTVHATAREARRCARLLLRALLARLFGSDVARCELQEGTHGKPFLLLCEGLTALPEFSLSHSQGYVAVALSLAGPVGVDVEATHLHENRAQRLARRILDPHALQEWNALDEGHREAAFLRQWTMREALLKATGEGLTRDPRTLVLQWHARTEDVPNTRATASVSEGVGADCGVWEVHVLQNAPHVSLAARPGVKVKVF